MCTFGCCNTIYVQHTMYSFFFYCVFCFIAFYVFSFLMHTFGMTIKNSSTSWLISLLYTKLNYDWKMFRAFFRFCFIYKRFILFSQTLNKEVKPVCLFFCHTLISLVCRTFLSFLRWFEIEVIFQAQTPPVVRQFRVEVLTNNFISIRPAVGKRFNSWSLVTSCLFLSLLRHLTWALHVARQRSNDKRSLWLRRKRPSKANSDQYSAPHWPLGVSV